MLACVYKHPACVAELARLHANPFCLDDLGRGALHYAALVGAAECIGALLGGYDDATNAADGGGGSGGGGGYNTSAAGAAAVNGGGGGGNDPEWAIPAPNGPQTRLVDARSAFGLTALHYAVWADAGGDRRDTVQVCV
jgi:ankyrin repeat protein